VKVLLIMPGEPDVFVVMRPPCKSASGRERVFAIKSNAKKCTAQMEKVEDPSEVLRRMSKGK
jgi:hypothetical protein